jgi:plastocyanin
VLLAGLSTDHKIGLAVVGVVFIAFALSSSFLAPRRWPDFPGRNGLSVFIIACFVLFGAMLTAVEVFGRESEAKGAEGSASIEIKESEYKIAIPSGSVSPGKHSLVVKNDGQIAHDLVIQGPGVALKGTPTIKPGGEATLAVTLKAGRYTLFCAIDGHRKLGMQATLTVG